MKTSILIAFLLAGTLQAKQIWSPDHTAKIEAGESIDLFDERSQTMLTLISQTRGTNEIEVLWSPDSRKVVIAQDYARGSVIYGAVYDNGSWHKTIQTESDFSPAVKAVQRMAQSPIISEHRKFAGWLGLDAVRVRGVLRLRNGRSIEYEYRLEFIASTGVYDRGGYEEGLLASSDYKTL